MNPYRLGWHGDTLWVFDGILRRLSLISSSMELLETVSNIPRGAHPAPELEGQIPIFPFMFPRAVGRDRLLYGSLGLAVNQEVPERFDGRSTLGRVAPDGLIRDIILILPPSEGGGVTSPEGGSASLPFGNSPEDGIAPEVGRVAVAMASLEGPDAETFSLTVTDLTGDTAYARRFRFDAEVLPAAVADSVFEDRLVMLDEFSSSLADAARREWRAPPIYPPLTDLLIGSDGSIWIARRERDGQQRYHVVSADGDPVGTVSLPEGSEIGAARLDRIWVIERDELGIQSVVRYGVGWGP